MELNGKKTKELRITISDHNFDLGNQLLINNEPVRVVSKAKLLGITLLDDLKWMTIFKISVPKLVNAYIF
jgi:hypothetical protein